MTHHLILPPQDALIRIGSADPLPYYYKPVVGRLYQHRINVGLRHLPDHCGELLDIGYGSGILLPTLAARCTSLTGIDIHPHSTAVAERLRKIGVTAKLISADARKLPYPNASFDVIVAFSFMEHVAPIEPFITEMLRVLKPQGRIVLGMPMVNKAFNALFPLIGYFNIEDQHITSPSDVRKELRRQHLSFIEDGIPAIGPSWTRIYTIFEIRKADTV